MTFGERKREDLNAARRLIDLVAKASDPADTAGVELRRYERELAYQVGLRLEDWGAVIALLDALAYTASSDRAWLAKYLK